jgi:hypothetical protein
MLMRVNEVLSYSECRMVWLITYDWDMCKARILGLCNSGNTGTDRKLPKWNLGYELLNGLS